MGCLRHVSARKLLIFLEIKVRAMTPLVVL